MVLPRYRIPVFQELQRREGIDLTVVYSGEPDLPSVEAPGFTARREPAWRRRLAGRPIYWHSSQLRYASPEHADVLILSGDPHYLSLVPALRRARRRRVPTILWTHGVSKSRGRVQEWVHRRLMRMSDAVIVYSEGVARRLVEAGLDRRRVFPAINSLDQSPVREAEAAWRSPERLEAFRASVGLGDGPTILFVSRLGPDRRADLLLKAAARLAPRMPDLRIVLIGGGDRDGLEGLARDLGLGEQVRFVGALYEEQELAPWFLCASVFCVPSMLGLGLLHAFGYGLPVVTTDRLQVHGPEIEALDDGGNGLLYRDGCAESLAGALGRILEDPTLRARMSAAARRQVAERFTIERMVDEMEAAVRFCVEPDAGNGRNA